MSCLSWGHLNVLDVLKLFFHRQAVTAIGAMAPRRHPAICADGSKRPPELVGKDLIRDGGNLLWVLQVLHDTS